jgi:hypothetical protein
MIKALIGRLNISLVAASIMQQLKIVRFVSPNLSTGHQCTRHQSCPCIKIARLLLKSNEIASNHYVILRLIFSNRPWPIFVSNVVLFESINGLRPVCYRIAIKKCRLRDEPQKARHHPLEDFTCEDDSHQKRLAAYSE